MDKYNHALHDLLNHLRDQPATSSGWDMLKAAEGFVAEYEAKDGGGGE